MRLIMGWLVSLATICIISILIGILLVQSGYGSHIVSAESMASSSRVAIIFGAGLNPDGTPREMLEARVKKGIELLQSGQVGRLLFTGAKDFGHNEPDAMRDYALARGIKPEQILMDYNGDTTFDSCYNAAVLVRRNPRLNGHGGQVTPNNDISAVLVTQKFHLPRALYLCNNLGVKSIGVAASSTDTMAESAYAKREYLASIKAWLQINFPGLRRLF